MTNSVLGLEDGFKKSDFDRDIEQKISDHCLKFGISPLEAVKLFPVLLRRQSLKRFLAHVDLFKQTLEVPGDILELGVYRGLGLMTWANLLEAYCIGDRTKIVWGFDNWLGFTQLDKEDGECSKKSGKVIGGFNPEAYFDELISAIQIFDADRFMPSKARVRLIKGNLENTLPKFINENPGVRFSLVHFDCDLYLPTLRALEEIWDRVVRGGILLFDEYAIHDWPGESRAVDQFFNSKLNIKLKTFSWTNTPGAYLVKE